MRSDHNEGPVFSVVIPTFERNDLLARCLECLAPGKQEGMEMVANAERLNTERLKAETGEQKEESRKMKAEGGERDLEIGDPFQLSEFQLSAFPTYEVIVSDDGRTTTAEAMIRERFPWARWVAGPGTGPAANRNTGAAVACGNWLAFTDDDCHPQPGWLGAYYRAFNQNQGHNVFEGNILPDRPRQTLAEHAPVGGGGGNLWSCNFAIRRTAFQSLGGFDPQFRVCMEDSDFALRVRLSGMVFPFVEHALVLHPWRQRRHFQDGWKSSQAEVADHLRFKSKHWQMGSITPVRMIRLGLRVFWCDVSFVVKMHDWRGFSYAVMSLCHVLNVAWHCTGMAGRNKVEFSQSSLGTS